MTELTDINILRLVREYVRGEGDPSLGKITDWDVSNITKMSGLFEDAEEFNEPLHWDTSKVIKMDGMFANCSSFNQELIYFDKMIGEWVPWNTKNVTDMSYLFRNCIKFNHPLNIDTSNVIYMQGMFSGCNLFKHPVLFDTNHVIDMSYMFMDCTSFDDPVPFDTSSAIDMSYMFSGCKRFNHPVPFDTSSARNMSYMFSGCNAFNQPFHVNAVHLENNLNMFENCDSLKYEPELNFLNRPLHDYDTPYDAVIYVDAHSNFSKKRMEDLRDTGITQTTVFTAEFCDFAYNPNVFITRQLYKVMKKCFDLTPQEGCDLVLKNIQSVGSLKPSCIKDNSKFYCSKGICGITHKQYRNREWKLDPDRRFYLLFKGETHPIICKHFLEHFKYYTKQQLMDYLQRFTNVKTVLIIDGGCLSMPRNVSDRPSDELIAELKEKRNLGGKTRRRKKRIRTRRH